MSDLKGPQYVVMEPRRADEMFMAPSATAKWAALVAELLGGKSVFVAGMTRIQLESLRTVIRYRTPHVLLLSKHTEMDGKVGRLLRVGHKAKAK